VILGGAKAIEHGFNLDNELLKLMVEKGTYLSGTDFTQPHLEAMGMPGKWAGKLANRIVSRLKNAHELGVNMVFSTDVVVDLPGMNRAESNLEFLNAWKAAKIPNEFILKALTINNAELFGMGDILGKIEPGFKADLIAVPANPLDDIDILKKVSFVMKGGKVMVHERT
jgi:imidazolonepropionase-like amidohydrolase